MSTKNDDCIFLIGEGIYQRWTKGKENKTKVMGLIRNQKAMAVSL